MKHSVLTYLLLASLTLPVGAQSMAEKRAYIRLGAAWSQNDLKAYLGDRAFNPIYEVGYDFPGYTETTSFGVYVSYLTAHGDPIAKYAGPAVNHPNLNLPDDYEGLKQSLFGWRVGVDLRFRTPINGFTPFVGVNLNYYDGMRHTHGYIQEYDNKNNYYELLPGSWPAGRAKFGMRVGAEYRITEHWGVSIDGSVSSWHSRTVPDGSVTGQRHYKGINPVAPSWINFAVQYRWGIWQ